MVRLPGKLTVIERAPAAHPMLVQLEEPSHLVGTRVRAVLIPVPHTPYQRQSPLSVLEQLLHLDRLLHPAWFTGCPPPGSVPALAQTLHRMKLDLPIEHSNESVQIALVECANELSNGIVAQGPPR